MSKVHSQSNKPHFRKFTASISTTTRPIKKTCCPELTCKTKGNPRQFTTVCQLLYHFAREHKDKKTDFKKILENLGEDWS